MIGGVDIVVETTASSDAVDVAIRAARRMWRNAVVEDAVSGDIIELDNLFYLGHIEEILIYENQVIADRWRELGADNTLLGTMVHILISPEEITVVIDECSAAPVYAFVETLKKALVQDIFMLYAEAA